MSTLIALNGFVTFSFTTKKIAISEPKFVATTQKAIADQSSLASHAWRIFSTREKLGLIDIRKEPLTDHIDLFGYSSPLQQYKTFFHLLGNPTLYKLLNYSSCGMNST